MKKGYVVSIITLIVTIASTFVIKTVDVAPIGPNGTSVGLSHINQAFHECYGVNVMLYNITEPMMYLGILVAGFFAIMGLVQLIKRRNLLAVDHEILGLGVVFLISMSTYAVFEKIIVSYRPEIMPGETELEASFPSSHTMLVIVILGAASMLAGKYLEKGSVRTLIRILCVLIIAVTVIGRLICGCHWLTDIVTGALMSVVLLSAFRTFISQKPGWSQAPGEPKMLNR